MRTRTLSALAVLLLLAAAAAQAQTTVRGVVLEKTPEGAETPLAGANVRWLGTTVGTITRADGSFTLPRTDTATLLVTSVGYRPDTLIVSGESVRVFLQAEPEQLGDVEVVGERSSTYLDYMNPVRTQVMTEKELYKAACCNLSESFETNPSIDVAFTDAITGTRQIEMLGLAGTYSQITLENLPAVRGLTSNVGLTYIPGTWIENIQVSKGVGSVANGYESITGQINVELRKPTNEEEPHVYLNLFGNHDLRLEGNLHLRERLGGEWTSLSLLHGSLLRRPIDLNGDRFLDMPLASTMNVLQRFHGLLWDEVEIQVNAGYVGEEREGGTSRGVTLARELLAGEPAEYGFRMRSDQARVSGKVGYLPSSESQASVGLQWSFTDVRQRGWFGVRPYEGRQRSGYLNLLYEFHPGGSEHRLRTGASLMLDRVTESFPGADLVRSERVPGVFAEYTFSPGEELAVVAGLRADHHNLTGGFVTPRLHVRYALTDDWVLRAVAGRGQRMASILAENVAVLASSRTILLPASGTGYPFGPEVAWNVGMNLTHYFLWDYREATVTVDVYRTVFTRQVVVNQDRDPQEVRFSNLDGTSFSNSFQAELNVQPVEGLDTRLAYRYLDVRQTVDGVLRERPLVARHRAFLNLGYAAGEDGSEGRMAYDFTLQWFGGKRLPDTRSNPDQLRRPQTSPPFFLVNMQVTRSFSRLLDLYLGVENLFDFRQSDPILDPGSPQGPFFDSSLIWGPVAGRTVYLGLRWRAG